MCDWKLENQSWKQARSIATSRVVPTEFGGYLRALSERPDSARSCAWKLGTSQIFSPENCFWMSCSIPSYMLILEVSVGRKNCMKMICRLEFDRPSCRRFKQCLQDISRRSSLGVPDHGISFFPGKTSDKVWTSYHVRV